MKFTVTRGQIVARGLTHRCPNCGERTLFTSPVSFRLQPKCERCGLAFERDEGSFLGAISLNYGVTVCGILVPLCLAYLAGWIGGRAAVVSAGLIALFFPVLFYRSSRSWWLMNYYLVVPHHLPANQREVAATEDANT